PRAPPPNCRNCLPVEASRRRSTPTALPEATRLPSGEKATHVAHGSGRRRRSFPVSTSQRRTVPSAPAEARFLPPGAKAREETGPPCRQRAVPIRTRAPGGRGSPASSAAPGGGSAARAPAAPGGAAGCPRRIMPAATTPSAAKSPDPTPRLVTDMAFSPGASLRALLQTVVALSLPPRVRTCQHDSPDEAA